MPSPSTGWFDYRFAALQDGRLGIARTQKDIDAEHRARFVAMEAMEEPVSIPMPSLWDGSIQISVFDGRHESHLVEISAFPFTHFDRTSDGEWLLAYCNGRELRSNGIVFSSDGDKLSELYLGDAIEHMFCSPDGSIWLGYFDEGIFAFRTVDGSRPISSHAIVQLDTKGELQWSAAEDGGFDIADCYALGLSHGAVWTCFYEAFDIVRIEGGASKRWSNEVTGASAIAAEGDHVLLAGGYGEAKDDLTLMRLKDESATIIDRTSIPGARGNRQMFGRNGVIHVIADGKWHQASVRAAVAEMAN